MAKKISVEKTNEQPYFMCSVVCNRAAMQNLTKSAYYLYMYFLQNQDGYNLTLRRSHAIAVTGLSKSTYYIAFQELVDKGYICEGKDCYEFYENPQDAEL